METLSSAMLWAIVGLVLLAIEMLTTTFAILFFGVAALAVAGLKQLGLLDSLATEIFVFAALGVAGLAFFRKQLERAFRKGRGHDIDRHAVVIATADLPPRGSAKIEYQGALWDAENDSDQPVRRGDRIVVVKTEGIKLVVRPHT